MRLINNEYNNVDLDRKVDFVLVDIPYNIGRDAYASNPQWWKDGDFKNGKSEKANGKFFETDEGFNIDNLLKYIYINLKENSSAVIFCSWEQQFEIINKMKQYGFKKYIPLVFIKNNSAEVLKSNMRIVGACEYGLQIFNGNLGKFNNNKKMIKNWFNMRRISGKKKHPNEKPVELLEEIIELFTDENETVLDMCMGSGSTAVACINTKRDFIGIELEQKYYEIAIERVKELFT